MTTQIRTNTFLYLCTSVALLLLIVGTWTGIARAGIVTINATETVTVPRAGTMAPGTTPGTYVLREREPDSSEFDMHISAFSNFDLSSVGNFILGAGDKATFELDFQGRLNTSTDSPLYAAQVTGGNWSSSSLPDYQWATKSPATAGPGSQTREHIVVPNVKTNAFGTYSVDVTDIVDAWVNGGDANYGLGIYVGDAFQGAGFDSPTLHVDLQSVESTVAIYDFDGPNGNFNTTAFDSRDVDPSTSASSLSQSGGLTGGGANTFIQATNNAFNTSNSGPAGLNVAGANDSTPTDYFSFITGPEAGAASVTYEDLSFFANTYGGSASVSLRMVDGTGPEVSLAEALAVPGGNADVELFSIDFLDFTSSNLVEWRLYPYGTSDFIHGVRFDDILLHGTANMQAVPEPSTFALATLGLMGLACFGWRRRWRARAKV